MRSEFLAQQQRECVRISFQPWACCNALYRALLSYAMVGAGSGVWWLFVSANVR
jgi:hypothetical protein